LNPVAAGIVDVPESSPDTSIRSRVGPAHEQGGTASLHAASFGSVAGSKASAGLDESIWLCSSEDQRKLDSEREGMLVGFPLGRCFSCGFPIASLPRQRNTSQSRF
jgi:hypothetical protein